MIKRLAVASLLLLLLIVTPSYADLGRRGGGGPASVCVVLIDVSLSTDNFEFWMNTYDSATVTEVSCHCRGTCTPPVALFTLEDRSNNSMTHTQPTCSTGTNNSVPQLVTANNTLVDGEGLAVETTNTPGSVLDEYTICVTVTHSSS
jgi:hypothetical protein